MCVCLEKKLQGDLGENLQFPKLSVVEDRLNFIGFLGFWPETNSYDGRFIFNLICELNAKGNVFTFVTMCRIVNLKLCVEMCSIGDCCSLQVH